MVENAAVVALEALVVAALLRRDRGLGIAEEVEQRVQQLRMAAAMVAFPVVLDRQLPIAFLDQVDLVRDFQLRQAVRQQVGQGGRGEIVEIAGRFGGQADEDQARQASSRARGFSPKQVGSNPSPIGSVWISAPDRS